MSDVAPNFYRSTPREIREFITDCLMAGLVPLLRASPGVGKSSIIKSIAKELKLKVIDHRLSTSEPTDMSGLPQFVNGFARFAPFQELFPLAGTPIPNGYDGWMIFFDEFNSAPKAVQAACYKVILDRMIGQHMLHENVVMVCAGNLDTDRAIVNPIGTAMQSRVVHLEMEVSHDQWMQDVAIPENYDSRIIAFLNQYPSKLMDFRPEHNEKTFCCPRTWEFMNRLINGNEVMDSKTALYAGTITSGVAAEFVQYTKIFKTMVSIKDILADPLYVEVPQDSPTQWAVISHMMEKVDPKNFESLSLYANKFPMSFRIVFYRSILLRHPELKRHTAFVKVQSQLSKYLYS